MLRRKPSQISALKRQIYESFAICAVFALKEIPNGCKRSDPFLVIGHVIDLHAVFLKLCACSGVHLLRGGALVGSAFLKGLGQHVLNLGRVGVPYVGIEDNGSAEVDMIGERAVFLNLIIAGGKNYVQGVFLTVDHALLECGEQLTHIDHGNGAVKTFKELDEQSRVGAAHLEPCHIGGRGDGANIVGHLTGTVFPEGNSVAADVVDDLGKGFTVCTVICLICGFNIGIEEGEILDVEQGDCMQRSYHRHR